MKLGFYDSGLGGLSILKSFLDKYRTQYEYFYYGDSARAPYGDKTPEELISYMKEIFQIMHEKEVDLVISACNTSSALLDQVDLEDYFFQVISLTEIVRDYFENSVEAAVLSDFNLPVGLLATQGSINTARYKEWGVNVQPIACTKLVPLMEAGDMEAAKIEWQNYLQMLDTNVEYVVVGCTHYSFLIDEKQLSKYKFIDPANLATAYFEKSIYSDSLISYKQSKDKKKLDLEIEFSKCDDEYFKLAEHLLSFV
jgi:glutamate racemase